MIRIDEIYNHTFWPWIEQNRPGRRLFFCDPFGHSDPQHLVNLGRNFDETGYVFCHDQEPIQLESHRRLFECVFDRNWDLININKDSTVIVSELGEHVDKLCDSYSWRSVYYFFHGWACLDWYRGYHRTFLFPHPSHRPPAAHTFMSPNRIMGGERDHRVLFLYHVVRNGLNHNYVSAPAVCPVEHQPITDIAKQYVNMYPDIEQELSAAGLPWLFANEEEQKMTSCWLGNFVEATNSLIYVPTETVYFGRRTHITEKTFKAIALGMPFIMVAAAGSLEYMRSYGFRTFSDVWDESYDTETNDIQRLERVVRLLADIDGLTDREHHQIQRHVLPAVEHNWNHFYHGDFERILWTELIGMLHAI
jgi:hypothetical protein